MPGQSAHSKRRYNLGAFHSRYFVGHGLDVGGATDPLTINAHAFRGISGVDIWDLPQGDAQYLATIPDSTYDFLHSSHTLEHLDDPRIGLENWIRVVKPGGYLVITVPDEDMYEGKVWPSRFNIYHKWSFTIHKDVSWNGEKSINVLDICRAVSARVAVDKIELIREFYNENIPSDVDQCYHIATAECAIEFILRRHPAEKK